jgi:hypothetical protein
MKRYVARINKFFMTAVLAFGLAACNSGYYSSPNHNGMPSYYTYYSESTYESRMPEHYDTHGEKMIVVNPNVYTWGAYNAEGHLVKAGPATAGGNWCPDIERSCRTSVGTFRIYSLGDSECISRIYPLPDGGGLMPYCMYFSNGEALHGSPDGTVVEANVSHGCVRMRIQDAAWLRNNFAQLGTKVVIEPY